MLTDINRQARGPPGRGRGHTPATSSWAMDFLTRKGESRKSIHDWLRDRKIPWQRRRRLIQVMANCFPTGSYLALIGQRNSAHCELCQRLRPDVPIHQLPRETLGHIQSAWCVAQGDVVREAHNNCVNRIVRDFQSPEISSIGLTILTAEGEKTMQSLWTMDPFAQMGTWEQFVEATWSARCFRLHIDGTKLEAETSSQAARNAPTLATVYQPTPDCRRRRWSVASARVPADNGWKIQRYVSYAGNVPSSVAALIWSQ